MDFGIMRMQDLFKEKTIYTVAEITRNIREILEDSFPQVWIKGEVSTLRIPQSGHMYFTLKDEKAQLKCVFFKNASMRLDFKLEEGMECVCSGRISLYDQSGQYQLYVNSVEPLGKGSLQLAYEQLKKKLAAEGLFDPAHKRVMPFLPRKIGIVTSSTGAAIRDILQVINRRYANVHIIIRPCLVQGKTAALDIAQAIEELNSFKDIDVIIVGRGGGSLEDLWAFNEEPVARAVYNSQIPIISAVGHEIDFTICDFVADLRAPTPSAAAELVVQEKEQLVLAVESMAKRLTEAVVQKLKLGQMRFSHLMKSYALRRPQVIVEQYQQNLDNLDKRLKIGILNVLDAKNTRFKTLTNLESGMSRLLKTKQSHLAQISARLLNLNPLAILSRGYSVTYLCSEKKALKSVQGLKKGDMLETKLDKGVIISQVEECRK
ncbi:MAG: exodeoxyribonuclease VII large subunit [Candidatus Omnitrophica bacterium]|nr:exodeoxyribonuclease VII large subunit [Candidatus Omnitrophota bacterium]